MPTVPEVGETVTPVTGTVPWFTVTVQGLETFPSMVTVTVAMPAALAVILPEEGSTEAMVEGLLAQLTLLGFASLGVIAGASVDSCPTVRDNVLGMVTLSTGFSTGTGSETLMVQSLVI